ncbi:MAG: hypothetical protein Q4F35_02715 [Akkermansia sp.]|nr:hypothetical protein [Akkermansia sp.]
MKTRILFFVGGVLAAAVAKLACGCPRLREISVKGLARGMQVAEKAKGQFQQMKKEAEGMCKEAKACAAAQQQGKTCCSQSAEKDPEHQA